MQGKQGHNTDGMVVRQFSLGRAINRYVLAVVFFGLLSLPVLWLGRPSFAPTLQENRLPEPFPHYSLFWLQQFDRWFSDRFGMRDALVYYGARLQMARTGTPMNQDVVAGRDGWFFFDSHYTPGHPHFAEMLGQAPLTDTELRTIANNLTQVRKKLQACGIPFYFVLAPDKQTIYPEKLWVQAHPGTETQADQFVRYMASADAQLKMIDLRDPLRKAKAGQAYELYKRTDTHWNTLGAFIGYQAITDRLADDGIIARSQRASIHAYRITRKPFEGGDIVVNLLSLPGYFKDYVVTFDPITPRHARLISLPGWPAQGGDVEVTDNPTETGGLLLFRDSFSGELMPFFAEDFNRMYSLLAHRVNGDAVRRAKPNVVIFEIIERNIRYLEDGPTNLENVCGE